MNIGIEEARKSLGPLVTAAQQGSDVVLTRNGRPVARIVRYQEESMSTSVAHGTVDYCYRCGHQIRMQRILFGEPVEPTWRSDGDESLWCQKAGQEHSPGGGMLGIADLTKYLGLDDSQQETVYSWTGETDRSKRWTEAEADELAEMWKADRSGETD